MDGLTVSLRWLQRGMTWFRTLRARFRPSRPERSAGPRDTAEHGSQSHVAALDRDLVESRSPMGARGGLTKALQGMRQAGALVQPQGGGYRQQKERRAHL